MAKSLLTSPAIESPVTFSGKPLTGILLEPIEPASLAMIPTTGNRLKDVQLAEIRAMAVADANNQFVKRIYALMSHYEISADGNWGLALAVKLARDFVPGFQLCVEAKVKHRPQGTYTVGGAELFEAVQARVHEGATIKGACKDIARTKGRWKNHNPAALETAYHSFVRKTKQSQAELQAHPIYGPLMQLVGLEQLWEHTQKLHQSRNGV